MIIDNFEGKVIVRDRSLDAIIEMFNGVIQNLSTEKADDSVVHEVSDRGFSDNVFELGGKEKE